MKSRHIGEARRSQAMERHPRITTLDELRRYLVALFDVDITAEPSSSYRFIFLVDGKIQSRLAQLQAKTGKEQWDGQSRFYRYRSPATNVMIRLVSAPGCVVVTASLFAKYRKTLSP